MYLHFNFNRLQFSLCSNNFQPDDTVGDGNTGSDPDLGVYETVTNAKVTGVGPTTNDNVAYGVNKFGPSTSRNVAYGATSSLVTDNHPNLGTVRQWSLVQAQV